MVDYYLDGEERFGWVTSPLYWLLEKMPSTTQLRQFALDDLKDIKGKRILDVGTGPGDVPIELAKSGNFKKVYGVDPSDAMLAIARMRSKEMSNVSFLKGSSRKLPFDKKFDMIISVLSFHHWKMKWYSLKHIGRFLKEGGEFRIYEFQRPRLGKIMGIFVPHHSVTKEQVYESAQRAGLKVKSVKEEGKFIRVTLTRLR